MSCVELPGGTAATIWSSSDEQRGWGRAELLCCLHFLYTLLSLAKTRCLQKSMLFGDNEKMLLEGVALFFFFQHVLCCGTRCGTWHSLPRQKEEEERQRFEQASLGSKHTNLIFWIMSECKHHDCGLFASRNSFCLLESLKRLASLE